MWGCGSFTSYSCATLLYSCKIKVFQFVIWLSCFIPCYLTSDRIKFALLILHSSCFCIIKIDNPIWIPFWTFLMLQSNSFSKCLYQWIMDIILMNYMVPNVGFCTKKSNSKPTTTIFYFPHWVLQQCTALHLVSEQRKSRLRNGIYHP